MKLHIASTDNPKVLFLDAYKTGCIEELMKERSVSNDKNKHKLSEIEEEIYKLLSDKYNQI